MDAADAPPEPPPTRISARRAAGGTASRRRVANQIPDAIANDPQLAAAIGRLPSNYNFEIRKTVWRLKQAGARSVALQFPEGLLLYACPIADILQQFAGVEPVILGDVTYGACCIDDFSAQALGADFLVHYGHSCLVPIDVTALKVLYVFVDIAIDVPHLVASLKANFAPETRLAVMGTIQFATSLHATCTAIKDHFASVAVPQAKPLSGGEVLGCTAPPNIAEGCDVLVFVADGRFHLEAAMIANPGLRAVRYDPYNKAFTEEAYDTEQMLLVRSQAVQVGREAQRWGVILGTLGRQGNPAILARLLELLRAQGKEHFVLLLSEVYPAKLATMSDSVDAWVQISCPRLSIDWGYAFDKPLLNPYEAQVALGAEEWQTEVYPMDYYSKGSGPWTNYHSKDRGTELVCGPGGACDCSS